MRSAPMAVLTITLIGCSGQPVPTAPSGPAPRLPQPVSIFMMVFDTPAHASSPPSSSPSCPLCRRRIYLRPVSDEERLRDADQDAIREADDG